MIERVILKYWQIKVIQIVLAIYILVITFTPVGTFGKYGGIITSSVGYIVDPASPERTEDGVILNNGVLRAVIATNKFQMFCMAVSRAGAFSAYPGEQSFGIEEFYFCQCLQRSHDSQPCFFLFR
jgi:hypothetical protein